MGQSQGSAFDTSYIDSLTKQVEGISVCSELQDFINDAMSDLKKQLSAVEDQIKALEPIAELLENPAAELPKIVAWIGNFIEGVLKPMYQPVVTMAEQIEQTAEAITKLEAAVVSKASEIGSCVINLPSNAVNDLTGSGSGDA